MGALRWPAVRGQKERAIVSGDPRSGGHVRALDGLRGVALLLVMLHHTNYSFAAETVLPAGWGQTLLAFAGQNGWAGVDLFFVLSGTLITTILLKSREATNYYRVFYVRRLLRLAPLYYLVLAVVFFLPWPHSVVRSHAPFSMQIWWWLNASNFEVVRTGTVLPMVALFWSLAVEEQFYLVWPVLTRQLRERTLLVTALAGAAAVPVLRVLPAVQWLEHRHTLAVYMLTPLHCEGLLLGAAVAILLRRGTLTRRALPALRLGAVLSAAASVLLLQWHYKFYTTPMLALGTAAVVAWLCLREGRGWLSGVLEWTPLRLIGRYSYAMYVTHALVLQWLQGVLLKTWSPAPGGMRLLWCYGTPVVLSFALGAFSWWAFDGRINRLKRLFPYRFDAATEGADNGAGCIAEPAATLAA